MSDWEYLAEEEIRKAIQKGQMENLPGEGKPLQLDEDQHTPPHLRLAYKLLRDNGLAPAWMLLGQELDEKRARLLANVRRGVRAYQGVLADAGRMADPQRAAEHCRRADTAWLTAHKTFCDAAAGFNRQITSYNLKVPPGVVHKPYLDIEREIGQMLGRV
jgi:hypothetical protein